MEVYIKALKNIPNFREAHVNLGQAYKDLGQLQNALMHFDMVNINLNICHVVSEVSEYCFFILTCNRLRQSCVKRKGKQLFLMITASYH